MWLPSGIDAAGRCPVQDAIPVLRTCGERANRSWCGASGKLSGGVGTGGSEEGDSWDGEPCGLHGTSGREERSWERIQLPPLAAGPQSAIVDQHQVLTSP